MVFNNLTKVFLAPIYYLIHHNYLFGYLHKLIVRKFYFKGLKFDLNIEDIPVQNYSGFLFKTYEYNDRKLIEKHISQKNKTIILGGGIGFVPALTFINSGNKILVFEINKKIIPNLEKNLTQNNVDFKIFNNNLVFEKTENKTFFLSNDFLSTSSRIKTDSKVIVDNLESSKIKDFEKFNTLVIDIEGDEEYYISNIDRFKNIKYLFFELHHNILKEDKIEQMMSALKVSKFFLKDKCFNSYYFER